MMDLTNIYQYFKVLVSLVFVCLYLRFLLEKCGQRWITPLSNTSTLVFLPFVTYVITKVIAGNIALSLGMVGALSIVRFRNPVRSPLELTVYFTAITLGIAAAVNIRWIYVIFLSINFISFILFLISKLSKKIKKKEFFNISFSEGNSISTLEIKTSQSIDFLDKSDFLKSKNTTNDYKVYFFVSNDFNLLKNLAFNIEKNDFLISYELNK